MQLNLSKRMRLEVKQKNFYNGETKTQIVFNETEIKKRFYKL